MTDNISLYPTVGAVCNPATVKLITGFTIICREIMSKDNAVSRFDLEIEVPSLIRAEIS